MKVTAAKLGFRVCAFVLLFSQAAKSQTTFVRMYNKGNMGYAVREVNANSYVVAGGTDFYYNWHWFIQSPIANTNIHLFKTNTSGVLQWERVIGKANTRTVARWMEPTADGGFIITGSANRDVAWPPDSNDVILVKTDGTGMISWSKVFDSGKDDLGFCVQQTADSGYIISGFHDAMPVNVALSTYILLIKTDSNGNVQWEKKYQFAVRDFNTKEPFSYVVKQTMNGGYVVVGTNAVIHPADVEVLRTDAAGNVVWAKTFEHDMTVWRNSVGLDIIETPSGDFVIAGSMDKDSPLHLNYPYFLRISSTGQVLKQQFYETVPLLNFQSGFSSVEQTTDGGFFFTGMGGYSDFGEQAQLLKTDASLDVSWSRVYTMDGAATVGAMSGRQTSDGGYVFTGKRQMSGSILMKTNGIGLVACKNPNALVEYTPSVAVSSWSPSVQSGILAASVLLNVTSPLIDTSIVCPVTVSALPVELNYFSAAAVPGNKVSVNWKTGSEVNNYYFIVERSPDNKIFEEAGIVTGAGNSTSLIEYAFVDEKPYPGQTSYYRLRQVDYDGTAHFSSAVAVRFASASFEVIDVNADHENRVIEIVVSGPAGDNATCSLADMTGKIILIDHQFLDKGFTRVIFEMNSNASGIYFFTVSGSAWQKVVKVVY
jgi:hypothetical protein